MTIPNKEGESYALLPSHISHDGPSRTGNTPGPSRPVSRPLSRAGSRPMSRRGSNESPRGAGAATGAGASAGGSGRQKARRSDDEMERGERAQRERGSRTGTPNGGLGGGSRPGSRLSVGRFNGENGHILWKSPEEDDLPPNYEAHEHEHEHDGDEERDHAAAPLLSRGSGSRDREESITEEEREEVMAEGSNSGGMKGTMLDGIANMANSILGAGIIGLPYAIAQAGFVMGVLLLIGLAIVTDWTIRLVVINAKLSGRDSYTDVMDAVFGHWGAASVSFFQFAFAFGGMCAFNVIIGDTIPHVIAFIFPNIALYPVVHYLVDRRVVIMIMTMAVSFPLSLHRDIVKLSKSSGFALVSMAVIVTSVVLRGVAVEPALRGPPLDALSLIRPGVFQAIGVISFAFVCHHNTMYIYQSIDTPTLDRFTAVTHASTGMSLVACLLMAVTGYLVFTSKTEGNILNNFSANDTIINIARLCFGANMSTTIPLENYVCREVIEDFFFKNRPFSYVRHMIVTSLIVFSAMAISLTTCDLGVVLEAAGGLSATALAFIFPASAYAMLIRGPWHCRQKLPAIACAAFGAIVLILSLFLTIQKAISGEGSGKVCT